MKQPDPQPSETTPPVNGTTTPTISSQTNYTDTANPDPPSPSENVVTEESVLVLENALDHSGSIKDVVLPVDRLFPSLTLEDPHTGAEDDVLPETSEVEGDCSNSRFQERSLQLD